jgi:hypothetical protein
MRMQRDRCAQPHVDTGGMRGDQRAVSFAHALVQAGVAIQRVFAQHDVAEPRAVDVGRHRVEQRIPSHARLDVLGHATLARALGVEPRVKLLPRGPVVLPLG